MEKSMNSWTFFLVFLKPPESTFYSGRVNLWMGDFNVKTILKRFR